jgi:hypothetical protein
VVKPERKRPLGRPTSGWSTICIRMYLGEIDWSGMDSIHLPQDRNSCEHGNEPSGSVKC